MKRILVNATQQEELRVAIVDGQKLYNLDIEAAGKKQKKGNIYKGVISSIAPSLNAVFVDYGGVRQGFLPTKEICPRYFLNKLGSSTRKRAVHTLVKEGQELIVQIAREEMANKGASITTYISLTGQYLVLMPDKSRARGISQRIPGADRGRMLDLNRDIIPHKNEGIILRTACLNAEKEDLQKNLDYLRYLWKQIQKSFNERPAPFLIYKEANIVLQTIQNNLGTDVDEIIVDDQNIYEEIKEFLSMVMPHFKRKLKLYNGSIPLFNRMQIETQIESLYQHKIDLPSGGAIVLDHTEALTAIDINSARSTQRNDLEETALQTNLEAVDEITRQLRLRDLGGLLVIDFIDMLSRKNKHKVEEHLRGLLNKDRARTRLGNISKFGLMEMSRQRLRPSLKDESEILCPRCNGRGFIRTVKSCALVVLRLIEEEAGKDRTKQVVGHVPVEVDKFLINEKRSELDRIERNYAIKVSVVSDPQMETPHYKITRHRENDSLSESIFTRSSLHEQSIHNKQSDEQEMLEVPAIPTVVTIEKQTFFETCKNLWRNLCGIFSRKKTPSTQKHKTHTKRRNYTSRKPRTSYSDRSRSTPRTRSATAKHSNYKNSASPQTQSSSFHKNNEKQSTSKPRSSYYNRRRDHRYRSKISAQKSDKEQTQFSSSEQHNDATHHPAKQTLAVPPQRNHTKDNSLAEVQAMEKRPAPNNAYKQVLFKKSKSKLTQIETKTDSNNNSK